MRPCAGEARTANSPTMDRECSWRGLDLATTLSCPSLVHWAPPQAQLSAHLTRSGSPPADVFNSKGELGKGTLQSELALAPVEWWLAQLGRLRPQETVEPGRDHQQVLSSAWLGWWTITGPPDDGTSTKCGASTQT